MRLAIGVGAYAALHVAAVLWPARLWGADMGRWTPLPLALAALLAAAALPAGPVRRSLGAAVARLPAIWIRRRRTAAAAAVLAAALGLAFLAFPSAIHLLGDGQLVLTNLERWHGLGHRYNEIQWSTDNAPLSTLLLFLAQKAVRAAGGGAEATLRAVDLVFGIAWIFLSAFAARFFGRNDVARSAVLAFLLTGGWMALFFGYVEVYAIVLPGVLAFLWLGARSLRGATFPLPAAVLLGTLLTLHAQTLTLAPALVFAAAAGPGRRIGSRAVRGAAALAIALGTTAAIAPVIAFDLGAYLSQPRAGNFYPLLGEPSFRHAYRLLAAAHFRDVLNELLLVAPVAVTGALIAPWRDVARGGEASGVRFLAVAAAGPLTFLFLANPEIGAFRDWDTMAFTGVPLTLLVGVLLAHRRAAAGDSAAVTLAGVAALHTMLWVVFLTSAPRGEARFVTLLETSTLSRHARGYGWESAGTYFRKAGRNEDAGRAYENAVSELPENSRLWTLAGECHLKAGRYDRSEQHFRRALELDPRNVPALAGLGATYANLERWDEAATTLVSAVTILPSYHPAWYNLAIALQKLGHPEEAERALDAAVEAGPDFAPAWLELGRARARRGDDAGASAAFVRFLELAPQAPEAAAIRAAMRAEGEGRPRP